jgi:hypothetical protein
LNGDKGLVSAIVPDHEMPHDANGQPYEALLNPLGIISRTNPAQLAEAQLGKIAAKTGQAIKVPDFEDDKDMTEWVQGMLRQHGLSDTEDVVIPGTGQKVKDIHTGNRFFVKLHHTAESKGQGRGGGGYSADETPSKGGETGCFIGATSVDSPYSAGSTQIQCVVENRLTLDVQSHPGHGTVTDWFKYSANPENLITLTLASRAKISCTRNHEFVLADGTRKRAGDLTPDDDLMEVQP